MPLGIFGIALGTAILPMLARHIQADDTHEAQRLQTNAIEIAMLLCLPCAVALAICSQAFTAGIFRGGKMTAADTAIMGHIVTALVAGPARLCADQGVPARLFQPRGYPHADLRRGRRAG